MNADDRRVYPVLLRTEFAAFAERCFRQLHPGIPFLRSWHIDLIASELAGLRTGSRQLIINLPPRQLKSLIGSVALPAWLLGHNPSRQIICASYGADLAGKLSRDCRAVMESPWYKEVFPTRLDRFAVSELTTTAHGTRMATSVDGVLTGASTATRRCASRPTDSSSPNGALSPLRRVLAAIPPNACPTQRLPTPWRSRYGLNATSHVDNDPANNHRSRPRQSAAAVPQLPNARPTSIICSTVRIGMDLKI